jgi:hypothetical protein
VWGTHILREKAGSRFLFVELLEGTSAAESTLTSHGTAFSWVEQATPFVGKPECMVRRFVASEK